MLASEKGYSPNLISTIVDRWVNEELDRQGYSPNLISTIVDVYPLGDKFIGYSPNLISTIVDLVANILEFRRLLA